MAKKGAQIDKVKTLEGSKSNKGEIFHAELKLLHGWEATMVTEAPNVSTFPHSEAVEKQLISAFQFSSDQARCHVPGSGLGYLNQIHVSRFILAPTQIY